MTALGDTQSIKHQRVKSFFIDAAKELVLSKGHAHATVRNIAARAGYAVSTLYQYFSDSGELLTDVKKSFIADLMAKAGQFVPDGDCSAADIKAQNRAFLEFFIEQPNVYPFLFSTNDPQSADHFNRLVFTDEYLQLYDGFAKRGTIRREDIPNVAKIIVYSMNGALQLYFLGKGPSRNDVYADLDGIIDFLLNK